MISEDIFFGRAMCQAKWKDGKKSDYGMVRKNSAGSQLIRRESKGTGAFFVQWAFFLIKHEFLLLYFGVGRRQSGDGYPWG